MRTLFSTLAALALTVLFALPALAQDAPTVAAQLTTDQQQRLETALEELQDVITQLSYEDSLTRAETDELRRSLATLYRDLESLRGRVAGYPDYDPDEGRSNVWTRFGDAALRLNPTTARYSGWKQGNSIRVSYGDAGIIYLTIDNSPDTARWTLRNAYRGGVQTNVKAETNGDVRLTVTDNRGTHEFLIKDGGLGPIYS